MSSDIEPHRLVEAAAWRTRLAEGQTGCSEELAAWVAEHPQNGAAWLSFDVNPERDAGSKEQ